MRGSSAASLHLLAAAASQHFTCCLCAHSDAFEGAATAWEGAPRAIVGTSEQRCTHNAGEGQRNVSVPWQGPGAAHSWSSASAPIPPTPEGEGEGAGKGDNCAGQQSWER